MVKDTGRELDMRNPEQRPTFNTALTSFENNKGVFPFATIGRTASGAPTREAPPEIKKGPEKQIQPSKKALYARLAGTLLALAATAGPATQHQITNETQVNLPAIGRDVASIPGFYWNFGKSTVEDISGLFGKKEIVVPSTFDPKASRGVIGENNTVQVNANEYEKVAPPLYKDNTLTIPMAVKFKDNKIRPLNIEMSENSGTLTKTVMTMNGLEEGDILISPIDGTIKASYAPWQLKADDSLQSSAFFIDATDGSKISFMYSTTGIKPLIEFVPSSEPEKAIPIKKGQPIAVLTTSNKHQFFNGQVRITGYAPLEQRLELATTSEGKAIVLQ